MNDSTAIAARYWWILLVGGVLGIAAGVIAIVYPKITLGVIALIFGIYLIISGVIELIAGIAEDDVDGSVRVIAALLGVLSLIAGVIVLRHPGQSLVVVALVFGIFLIVSGVLTVYRGATQAYNRGVNLTIGILDLIAGVIIAAWPGIGLTTLAIFIGIMFIIRGIASSYLAFQVKKLKDGGAHVVVP